MKKQANSVYDTENVNHERIIRLFYFLELNILERHIYRRPAVDLKSDDAFIRHRRESFIYGRFAIQFDSDILADASDVVVIEIIDSEYFLDDGLVGNFHYAAGVLIEQTSPELSSHITLGARDAKFFPIMDATANLHPAVAAGQLDFELYFKILVLPFTAQKCVELDRLLVRGADDRAILDAPEPVDETFPPG